MRPRDYIQGIEHGEERVRLSCVSACLLKQQHCFESGHFKPLLWMIQDRAIWSFGTMSCNLSTCHPAALRLTLIMPRFPSDIGWRPFVESWISTREDANEHQVLRSLFEKYVEATRTIVRKGFKEVTPLRVLNKVKAPISCDALIA